MFVDIELNLYFVQALRSIKQAAWGIKLQLARGWKKVGKVVLQTCYGNLKDTRMEHRLQEMLKEAGLPLEIDELPSDDSPRAYFTPMPQPPNDMNVDVMDDWLYSGRGFTRYLNAGLGIGESNQVTLFECKIEMSKYFYQDSRHIYIKFLHKKIPTDTFTSSNFILLNSFTIEDV